MDSEHVENNKRDKEREPIDVVTGCRFRVRDPAVTMVVAHQPPLATSIASSERSCICGLELLSLGVWGEIREQRNRIMSTSTR